VEVTTFENTISRAEAELAQVQSVLGTAQHVLEVADRAHTAGHRLLRFMKRVAILFAVGGLVLGVVLLVKRLWGSPGAEYGTVRWEAPGLDEELS
jgi:hypothetical protein